MSSPPDRQSMEEVLRDSSSTWKEIRTAMKSQGYHTNGGVVRALTSAQDLPTCTDIEGKFDLHVKETEKLRDEVCLHRSDSDDSISCDPPPAHLEYKPSKRKPAKNNPRRGLTSGRVNNNSLNSSGRVGTSFNSSSVGNRSKLTSSFKTTNTINSVNSSLASVDMMILAWTTMLLIIQWTRLRKSRNHSAEEILYVAALTTKVVPIRQMDF